MFRKPRGDCKGANEVPLRLGAVLACGFAIAAVRVVSPNGQTLGTAGLGWSRAGRVFCEACSIVWTVSFGMDTVHSASTEPELQRAMVTIRCKRKARSLCGTCITEAKHAPPVVRILNAKGNPKELTQAAGTSLTLCMLLAISVGYNDRLSMRLEFTRSGDFSPQGCASFQPGGRVCAGSCSGFEPVGAYMSLRFLAELASELGSRRGRHQS